MLTKRNIIIISVFLAVVVLALIGYFTAVPGAGDQKGPHPKIEISPEEFNFGEIEFGSVAEHAFKIKNTGNAVLEIKKIATSCGCTTAKTTKDRLEPNEETELQVKYETAVMGDSPHGKGDQERIIYIKTNDPLNPQIEAIIKAYVK